MTGGLRFTYRAAGAPRVAQTSWEAEWRAIGAARHRHLGRRARRCRRAEVTASAVPATITVVDPAPVALPGEGIAGSLRDFLARAPHRAGTPMGECHDNIKSLAMVMSALESSRTGRRVAMSFTAG